MSTSSQRLNTFTPPAWLHRLPAWTPRVLLSLMVLVGALWLYTSTAVPGLVVESGIMSESAELQRAAYRAGIAHSTGYPIYTMLGFLFARTGEALGGNPYTWVTYSSAFAGALALVVFFQLALDLTNPFAATMGTLALGVSSRFWFISIIPETQALHALNLIAILWMIVRHLRHPARFYPLAGMAFLTGVGLANHRTIVLALPAMGLAVLSTGAWRHIPLRRWLLLALLLIVPVLSYSYMFFRARDSHVVFSNRVTAYRYIMQPQEVVNIIRGTFANTEVSLRGNVVLPLTDFRERLHVVWGLLTTELTLAGVVAGVAGLALLSWRKWRYAPIFASILAGWVFFLMAWRLDWKSPIYLHALTAPLILGWVVLASLPMHALNWRQWRAERPALLPLLLLVVCSLPLFAVALNIYQANRAERDLSDDRRGLRMLAQLAHLPRDTIVHTGGWEPETFVLLEYMDRSGRIDIFPRTYENPEDLFADARHPDLKIWIEVDNVLYSPWGPYAGHQAITEHQIAFSATPTDWFVRMRPQRDPRLEPTPAVTVNHTLAPGVALVGYTLHPEADGMRVMLYWRALGTERPNYRVFAHLRHTGPGGEVLSLLSQDDQIAPVHGLYPTHLWPEGEIVRDGYFLPYVAPMPESGLTLTFGLINSDSGDTAGEFNIPCDAHCRPAHAGE